MTHWSGAVGPGTIYVYGNGSRLPATTSAHSFVSTVLHHITIAFRPAVAGNFQYTNFSQYYYDIEILLSTGSNLLTSKSSGAKQWSKLKRTETRGLRHLAAEFPKQCVYRRTREKKKGLAFCSLL